MLGFPATFVLSTYGEQESELCTFSWKPEVKALCSIVTVILDTHGRVPHVICFPTGPHSPKE